MATTDTVERRLLAYRRRIDDISITGVRYMDFLILCLQQKILCIVFNYCSLSGRRIITNSSSRSHPRGFMRSLTFDHL